MSDLTTLKTDDLRAGLTYLKSVKPESAIGFVMAMVQIMNQCGRSEVAEACGKVWSHVTWIAEQHGIPANIMMLMAASTLMAHTHKDFGRHLSEIAEANSAADPLGLLVSQPLFALALSRLSEQQDDETNASTEEKPS